jgi:vitamin K-dependent gamma-carboxylase
MGSRRTLSQRLSEPVDGGSVAVVRIALGLLIAIEAIGYLATDEIARSFLDPAFHFTYAGFDWVQPWPGIGLYLHFGALAALGLCVAAGVAHRITAPLLAIGFAYVFLLDKAEYLNHFYAALLLLALIAVAPADRALSVSAWRRPDRPRTVPVWAVWALRFQLGVIYAYAGIAKLGADWLAGEPLGTWLAARSDMALIGPALEASWAAPALSWGGMVLDLAAVPLLLWRRTRAVAFCLIVAFHVTNAVIFDIGIFPPMMIAATTVFFDPDWPRRAWARLSARLPGVPDRLAGAGADPPSAGSPAAPPTSSGWRGRVLVGGLALYAAIQLLVPLRHYLYPGPVNWTEEGHRFSWQMKLRDKQGLAIFTAVDRRTGERRALDPSDLITRRQYIRASVRPDMILQLAHRLAERERAAGRDVEIQVKAVVSLNGRPPRDLVDPHRDLAAAPRDLGAADWIEPEPPPLD